MCSTKYDSTPIAALTLPLNAIRLSSVSLNVNGPATGSGPTNLDDVASSDFLAATERRRTASSKAKVTSKKRIECVPMEERGSLAEEVEEGECPMDIGQLARRGTTSARWYPARD